MNVSGSSAPSASSQFFFLTFTLLLVIGITTGCGSSGSTPPPRLIGNTSVTLMLSSTANDQLSEFGLVLQSVALTSKSGTAVSLLNSPQGAEFMTVNGGAIPMITKSIPQDVYTAAAVSVGSAQFTCLTLDSSGGISSNTYAYGQTPAASVIVNLPAPITVTGDSMGISLDLQVSSSATFPSACSSQGIPSYSITPTFNVNPMIFSPQPTNAENGKVSSLSGAISAIGSTGGSFTLSLPIVGLTCPCIQPSPLTVNLNSNTVYQGIGSGSALAIGSLIDMDGIIQADGSVLATRVAVYDPVALNVMTGPLLFVDTLEPDFYSMGRQQQGTTYSVQPQSLGVYSFSAGTTFQISGQLGNVASLPFQASFNSSNMVAGQNVAVYSQAISDYYGGQYTAATTMTLMPQTINGTVVSSSPAGNFTDYTISLASYDLLPTLAVQPGQTTLLSNPSTVEVYIDSSAQLLNTQALAPGSTLRFFGLIFNDNGTLRMDCAQVNDGVSFTPTPSAAAKSVIGRTTTSLRATPKGMLPIVVNETNLR